MECKSARSRLMLIALRVANPGPGFGARSRLSKNVNLGFLLALCALPWTALGSKSDPFEIPGAEADAEPCVMAGGSHPPLTPAESRTLDESSELQNIKHPSTEELEALITRLQSDVASDPRNAKNVQALTLGYIRLRRYPLAETVITRYKAVCGPSALSHALDSELHFQQRQYDTAYREAQESLRISPNSSRMHELLGLVLILRREYQAALPEMDIATQQAADDPQVRYFYGRALYSTGHYPEALQEFLACLKLAPTHLRALENAGLCYEALQESAKAAEVYQAAIKLESGETHPNDVESYALYGALLSQRGRNADAITILQKALVINPQSFRANYELGKLFLDSADLPRAEHYLLQAATLTPTFAQTYYLLGKIYSKEHRTPDAESCFAVFVQLNKIPANREFPYPKD